MTFASPKGSSSGALELIISLPPSTVEKYYNNNYIFLRFIPLRMGFCLFSIRRHEPVHVLDGFTSLVEPKP